MKYLVPTEKMDENIFVLKKERRVGTAAMFLNISIGTEADK